MNEGRVGACIFTEPNYQVDDTALFDYSLFFVSVLYDYYMETKDEQTIRDLTATAYRQIELAVRELDALLTGQMDLISRREHREFWYIRCVMPLSLQKLMEMKKK